jgi:alpha-glucosidase
VSATRTDKNPWWRGAVLYQVYPRSFLDTNGDGIGDLNGIAARLPYIKSLGVDGLWISPFFRSPQDDFGYDVSDHLDVDPIFGTLEDFDRLLDATHELGLKLVVDQVYSHTSDRHTWFAESRASRDNAKVDWYVWADAKPDGSPPNNWLSVFGGPAWTWDARRRQYYLHNYLATQPDLNLHHPEVQSALLGVARFWLERGVDGLRLDAINYGMHDEALTDNPAAPPANAPPARPWSMQVKKYNTNHERMPGFLERIRTLTREYGNILTVAEVGGADSLPVMRDYTRGDDRLATAYGFGLLNAPSPNGEVFRRALAAWPNGAGEGWPSWAFSNHDVPRVATRWGDDTDPKRRARLFALLLVSLRGNLFLYQGEELGLPQAAVPFEALRDPEAIAHWPHSLGRDGARTPMPWRQDTPNAGFSDAEPWLPVDAGQQRLAVDRQETDPDSTLTFFRSVLRFRRESAALRHGDLEFLDTPADVLAFARNSAGERLLCVFNLGDAPVAWAPDAGEFDRLVAAVGVAGTGVPRTLAESAGYIAGTAAVADGMIAQCP